MPRNGSLNKDPFAPPLAHPFSRDNDTRDTDPFGPPIDYPLTSGHALSTDYSVESISDYLEYADQIQAEDIAIENEILLLSASLSNTEISIPNQSHTFPTIATNEVRKSIDTLPAIATNVIKEYIYNFLRLSSDNNHKSTSTRITSLYRSPKRKIKDYPCLHVYPHPFRENYPNGK